MRIPGRVSSCVPRGLDNLQQLCLLGGELKSLRMRDFEALRKAEIHGLLRQPIHRDPLADCSGGQVALVREFVKTKRAKPGQPAVDSSADCATGYVMVTALQVVFRSLALVVGGHRPVALENFALRQQLAAWTRSNRGRSGRPRRAGAKRTLVLTIPAGARAARTPSHAKSRRLRRLPGHPVQRSHPRADRRVGPAKRRPGDRRLTKGSVQRAEGISS